MIKNIINQRIYGSIISKNSFHLTKLFLAFLNHFRISVIRHDVIFLIDKVKCSFIKFQLDYTALIIDRSRSAILYSLRHVINIDIVAENLTGISILCSYRCSGKPNKCSIWKAVTNDTRRSNLYLSSLGVNFFLQSVLATMRLIGHNDDVTTH